MHCGGHNLQWRKEEGEWIKDRTLEKIIKQNLTRTQRIEKFQVSRED